MLCLGDKTIDLHFKNVPGIRSWRVLRLDVGTASIWWVTADILNKHSLSSDKGYSSSLVFVWGAKNCSP